MAASEVKCLCGLSSCSKVVQDRHNAVLCYGLCKKWWHISCANISKQFYDHFKAIANKMPGLKWYCSDCNDRIVVKPVNESQSGTVPDSVDESDSSAIMNIIVTELSAISKNNLAMSEQLSKLNKENIDIRKQLLELNNCRPRSSAEKSSSNSQEEDCILGTNSSEFDSSPNPIVNERNKPEKLNISLNKKENEGDIQSPDNTDDENSKNEFQIVQPSREKPFQTRPKESKQQLGRPGNNTPSAINLKKDDKCSYKEALLKKKTHQYSSNKPVGPHKIIGTGMALGQHEHSPVDSSLGVGAKSNSSILQSNVSLLTGEKKAWYHLGKLKGNTTEEQVQQFLRNSFPEIEFVVEKLDSKGLTSSFKLGLDFEVKDKILDSSIWPKYVTLKRFLFRRSVKNQKVKASVQITQGK